MYKITKKVEWLLYEALKETQLFWRQDARGNGLKLSNCLNADMVLADEELSNIAVDCAFALDTVFDGKALENSSPILYPVYYLGNPYANVVAWFNTIHDANAYAEMKNEELSDHEVNEGIEYSTDFEKFDEYPEANKGIE